MFPFRLKPEYKPACSRLIAHRTHQNKLAAVAVFVSGSEFSDATAAPSLHPGLSPPRQLRLIYRDTDTDTVDWNYFFFSWEKNFLSLVSLKTLSLLSDFWILSQNFFLDFQKVEWDSDSGFRASQWPEWVFGVITYFSIIKWKRWLTVSPTVWMFSNNSDLFWFKLK